MSCSLQSKAKVLVTAPPVTCISRARGARAEQVELRGVGPPTVVWI